MSRALIIVDRDRCPFQGVLDYFHKLHPRLVKVSDSLFSGGAESFRRALEDMANEDGIEPRLAFILDAADPRFVEYTQRIVDARVPEYSPRFFIFGVDRSTGCRERLQRLSETLLVDSIGKAYCVGSTTIEGQPVDAAGLEEIFSGYLFLLLHGGLSMDHAKDPWSWEQNEKGDGSKLKLLAGLLCDAPVDRQLHNELVEVAREEVRAWRRGAEPMARPSFIDSVGIQVEGPATSHTFFDPSKIAVPSAVHLVSRDGQKLYGGEFIVQRLRDATAEARARGKSHIEKLSAELANKVDGHAKSVIEAFHQGSCDSYLTPLSFSLSGYDQYLKAQIEAALEKLQAVGPAMPKYDTRPIEERFVSSRLPSAVRLAERVVAWQSPPNKRRLAFWAAGLTLGLSLGLVYVLWHSLGVLSLRDSTVTGAIASLVIVPSLIFLWYKRRLGSLTNKYKEGFRKSLGDTHRDLVDELGAYLKHLHLLVLASFEARVLRLVLNKLRGFRGEVRSVSSLLDHWLDSKPTLKIANNATQYVYAYADVSNERLPPDVKEATQKRLRETVATLLAARDARPTEQLEGELDQLFFDQLGDSTRAVVSKLEEHFRETMDGVSQAAFNRFDYLTQHSLPIDEALLFPDGLRNVDRQHPFISSPHFLNDWQPPGGPYGRYVRNEGQRAGGAGAAGVYLGFFHDIHI